MSKETFQLLHKGGGNSEKTQAVDEDPAQASFEQGEGAAVVSINQQMGKTHSVNHIEICLISQKEDRLSAEKEKKRKQTLDGVAAKEKVAARMKLVAHQKSVAKGGKNRYKPLQPY